MHKLSDTDKKIWNFYISNLKSIKKADKSKRINSSTIPGINKVLKPNVTFTLDSKIKKQLKTLLKQIMKNYILERYQMLT